MSAGTQWTEVADMNQNQLRKHEPAVIDTSTSKDPGTSLPSSAVVHVSHWFLPP